MNQITKRASLFPESIFQDFFTKDFFDWSDKNFSLAGSTLPSVNLKETDKSFEIEMAVPGMKKDDFKVELHNNILSISSEKKEEKDDKDKAGNYTRREFNYQSFKRSFTVPDTASEDQVNARYAEGILHITIGKKSAETKTLKQINVQ